MKSKSYGQIAYEAYCDSRKWKSVKGDPLPQFEQQSEELKDAWEDAANATIQAWHNATWPE